MAGGARLEEALHEARERAAQLQEEVTTTASNYETQLSTMSEHLANMNERLAQQKEIIDQLEYQVANKVQSLLHIHSSCHNFKLNYL